MVDGLPRREVVREQAPGAAAAQHVEDGVEDLAQRMNPGASGSFRRGQVRLDDFPLGIGEVGSVCSSHHARYRTGQPSQDPFSDGL